MLKAVTRFTLTPKQTLGPAIPFNMSRNMHATEARIDGRPWRSSNAILRSKLISSSDNDQFLLVVNPPLDAARAARGGNPSRRRSHSRCGQQVYYVVRAAPGIRDGTSLANYDLTFRYPEGLTVAATGKPMEDRVEGDWRITHLKTDTPVRFAGFNLGNFQSVVRAQWIQNRAVRKSTAGKRADAPTAYLPAAPSSRCQPFARRRLKLNHRRGRASSLVRPTRRAVWMN